MDDIKTSQLRLWLSQIKSMAKSLTSTSFKTIIIGTHYDSIENDVDKKKAFKTWKLGMMIEVSQYFNDTCNIVDDWYVVNARSVVDVHDTIWPILRSVCDELTNGKMFPEVFITLRKFLSELNATTSFPIMTCTDFKALIPEEVLNNNTSFTRSINTFIALLHGIGDIILVNANAFDPDYKYAHVCINPSWLSIPISTIMKPFEPPFNGIKLDEYAVVKYGELKRVLKTMTKHDSGIIVEQSHSSSSSSSSSLMLHSTGSIINVSDDDVPGLITFLMGIQVVIKLQKDRDEFIIPARIKRCKLDESDHFLFASPKANIHMICVFGRRYELTDPSIKFTPGFMSSICKIAVEHSKNPLPQHFSRNQIIVNLDKEICVFIDLDDKSHQSILDFICFGVTVLVDDVSFLLLTAIDNHIKRECHISEDEICRLILCSHCLNVMSYPSCLLFKHRKCTINTNSKQNSYFFRNEYNISKQQHQSLLDTNSTSDAIEYNCRSGCSRFFIDWNPINQLNVIKHILLTSV